MSRAFSCSFVTSSRRRPLILFALNTDPFHTYTSLAALSLLKSDESLCLNELDPVRNVGAGAVQWLKSERERLGWMSNESGKGVV